MAQGGKFEAKSLVGGSLGQFEVKAEIARGGMGVVYKGYQASLDRWVAIKTLPMDLAGDRDLVARFQREAKAMSLLNHANIVQVIDSGQDKGQYYMAMEYVEGPSIKDLLKSETIDTDKIFDILTQTCDGLEYAHKKNLVHRDIKPANLLYEEKTGVVKIADFGIAHFTKKDEDMVTLTQKDVGMGTMNYMAPEQKQDAGSVDHRADIYAVGVIVYEAFTGKLPLGKFKLPSEINPKLPRSLDAVVQKCLEYYPQDRYASCGDIKAALLEAKAATHDKTLRRSMRDALDRTLTAISPNRTVSVAVLGCLIFLLLGGSAAAVAYAVNAKSQQKKWVALQKEVEEAKSAAIKERDAGAPIEERIKTAEAAESIPADAKPDQKIAQLTIARKEYTDAIAAAVEWKKKRFDDLSRRLGTVSEELAKLVEDGFKKAGLDAASEARAALGSSPDSVDAKRCEAALDRAAGVIPVSRKFDEQVKNIESSIAKLPAEKQKEGKPLLDAIVEARKKGDVKPVNDAVSAATKRLDELGQKPVEIAPVKPPEVVPTADLSQKRYAMQVAEQAASDVRDRAGMVSIFDGKEDFEAGRALAAASEDPKLSSDDAAIKLSDAAKKFDAAREAAASALRAKEAQAKAAAGFAELLAPDAWAAAMRAEESAKQADRGRLAEAQLLVDAIHRFEEAAASAGRTGDDQYASKKATASAARLAAVKRTGEGHSSLKAGDDALALAAQKYKAHAIKDALAALGDAVKAFEAADRAVPREAIFTKREDNIRSAKSLNLDEDTLDAIAACPRGVIVAGKGMLQCRSTSFELVTQSDSSLLSEAHVTALCAGDGNSIYASTSQKRILEIDVEHSIKQKSVFADNLEEAPFALAYDPRSRLVLAGFKDQKIVRVYSADTKDERRDTINLKGSGGFPRSIAVLKDGSVAIVVQMDPPKDGQAEADWKFTLFEYRPEGEHWTPGGKRENAPAAIAPVGGGALGVNHDRDGSIVAWRSTNLIGDAPEAILKADPSVKLARTQWAMRLAVTGNHAWILDGTGRDTTLVPGLAIARRNRLFVYELRE